MDGLDERQRKIHQRCIDWKTRFQYTLVRCDCRLRWLQPLNCKKCIRQSLCGCGILISHSCLQKALFICVPLAQNLNHWFKRCERVYFHNSYLETSLAHERAIKSNSCGHQHYFKIPIAGVCKVISRNKRNSAWCEFSTVYIIYANAVKA